VSNEGLIINDVMFNRKVPLSKFREVLGVPTQSISAGGSPPVGFRNNQVHIFDEAGVYLTEHHASHLIESVNFTFIRSESLFPIRCAYLGTLEICDFRLHADVNEKQLLGFFHRDLPGRYSLSTDKCWVSIVVAARQQVGGRKTKARRIASVGISF